MAPKAEAFDGFLGSAGDYSLNEAAKLLQREGIETGQYKLAQTLLSLRWAYRDAKANLRAYQAHIEAGRLAEKTHWFIDQETGEKKAGKTSLRVTPKGLGDLAKKLGEKAGLRVIEGVGA